MNNICEKKWAVAIIAIFSSFVLTIIAVTCIEIFRDKIVLLCQNNIVPADKELGNNYMFHRISGKYPIIWRSGTGETVIDEFVYEYAYDERFILVFRFAGEKPYENPNRLDPKVVDWGNRMRIFRAQNRPEFWIIDKPSENVHGPLDLHEYQHMRDSLGVPEGMKMKLEFSMEL